MSILQCLADQMPLMVSLTPDNQPKTSPVEIVSEFAVCIPIFVNVYSQRHFADFAYKFD